MFVCRQRQHHLVFNAVSYDTCQANSVTSECGSYGAHTREQGCIDFAASITLKLGDVTVVNNDDETMQRTTSDMTCPQSGPSAILRFGWLRRPPEMSGKVKIITKARVKDLRSMHQMYLREVWCRFKEVGPVILPVEVQRNTTMLANRAFEVKLPRRRQSQAVERNSSRQDQVAVMMTVSSCTATGAKLNTDAASRK